MWSTYIMDLLLLLQAYELDFNGNGIIDMVDFLEMLSQQPPIVFP